MVVDMNRLAARLVAQSAAASSRSDSSLLLRLPQDVQSHIRGFLPLFPDRIRLCQLNRAAKNTSWTEAFSLCCRTCEVSLAETVLRDLVYSSQDIALHGYSPALALLSTADMLGW